jgi:uncharacterized protein (DUF983 family)
MYFYYILSLCILATLRFVFWQHFALYFGNTSLCSLATLRFATGVFRKIISGFLYYSTNIIQVKKRETAEKINQS